MHSSGIPLGSVEWSQRLTARMRQRTSPERGSLTADAVQHLGMISSRLNRPCALRSPAGFHGH